MTKRLKNQNSDIEEHISLFKAAKMLGVTSRTIRNWDYSGKINVTRTATNYRVIPISEIRRIQNRESSK
jgi:predicted site-specific integrase-resolvase